MPMHPGMQPGMHPQGGQMDELAAMRAEMAALKKDNAEIKEKIGYQEMSKKLGNMNGAFIKQKIDLLEVLTGCNRNNKYEVFDMQNGERKGKPLFLYREQSGCCSRMCLPADCRPLDMYVDNIQYGNDQDEVCLHINRPCKCTIYCFNRQEMQLNWIEKGQQKYLGKIVDPWDCCHYSFKVLDEEDKEMYIVKANCCQLGFQCGQFPYEACQTIKFDILEPSGDTVVGQLIKKGKGYCVDMFDLGFNNFKIDFPKNANWKARALLITCAVFIDFMMFEDNKKKGPAGASE